MLVPLPNRKQEFMPTENPPINWYALRVTYCREMIVKRRLDACGIESFVPMRYKETVCGQRRRRTLVAAVHNLLFVHTTAEQLRTIASDPRLPVRTITDRTTGSTLIVPDKQMRDFIAVAGNPDEQHIYLDPDSTELRRGDRVRITGGLLAGRGRVHAHPRRPSRGGLHRRSDGRGHGFHPSVAHRSARTAAKDAGGKTRTAPHRTGASGRRPNAGTRNPRPHIMTQPSIKENFAYKSVLTLSTYLIAFVTFPYVSRVLGVERVGLVNFADNTIGYFLLFATMGVNILGVREIAAVKEDPERRARVFSNILGLNLMFTAVTLAVFLALVAAVPKLHQHAGLFYIGTAKILFSAFLVEWFFTGIEQFRYITLRSIAVKVLYVASVFLFVRRPEDYRLYFILTVGVVVVNALVNTAYVRRYVRIRRHDLSGTNYVRRNLLLGVYSIMSAMYLTFNVMFLGFVADDTQVGYYTTAFKLYTVILGFFTAFTNVMLPRMSTLLAGGEQERFHALIDRSFRAMCLFSIPMIVCSIILAPQIIHLLAGPGYEGAILPMRLIMPAVLPVGIAQVLAIQVLMPMKRDRALLTASILGAAVSLAINIALVPRMQSIGTALVLLGAETTVTIAYVTYSLRQGLTRLPFDAIGRNLLIALAPAAVCLACARGIAHPLLALGTALPCSVLVWAAICYRTGQLSGLLRFGKR